MIGCLMPSNPQKSIVVIGSLFDGRCSTAARLVQGQTTSHLYPAGLDSATPGRAAHRGESVAAVFALKGCTHSRRWASCLHCLERLPDPRAGSAFRGRRHVTEITPQRLERVALL